MKVTIVSSSRREGKVSTRIALALEKQITKRGFKAKIIDLADLDLPPFTKRFPQFDDEDGKLQAVMDELDSSDGLIFLTPEYNGAISSSLKNFIDVFAKAPFEGKPIGVATGSSGAMGGIRAAYQLQQTILSIFGFPIPRMLTVGNMSDNISEDGTILQDSFGKKMDGFLDVYLGFVKRFLD